MSVDSKKNKAEVFYISRYLDNPMGFLDNSLFNFPVCIPSFFGDSVTDDSHFHPSSGIQELRKAVAAGSLAQQGVYDFEDGKDNGYTPSLRKIAPDPVEVDEAIKYVSEEAKKAKEKVDSDEADKQFKQRQDKALKGLEGLSDALFETPSSNNQE